MKKWTVYCDEVKDKLIKNQSEFSMISVSIL